MDFGDLLIKIANNARLTPQELDYLKRFGTETQQRNSFVADQTTPQQTLQVATPFFPIFQEVLTVNKSSFSIPNITQNYNHILIICNGRSTDAVVGPVTFNVQFNGDTGANYTAQYFVAFDATTNAGSVYNDTNIEIGLLVGDSSASGVAGSSFALITNYRSPFYKQIIKFEGYGGVGEAAASLKAGAWLNTSAIQSMLLFADSGNIKAGTAISLYGVL